MNNCGIDDEIKEIHQQLKLFVDLVLVRKDRRCSVGLILEMEEFAWIKESVPQAIVSFNQIQ